MCRPVRVFFFCLVFCGRCARCSPAYLRGCLSPPGDGTHRKKCCRGRGSGGLLIAPLHYPASGRFHTDKRGRPFAPCLTSLGRRGLLFLLVGESRAQSQNPTLCTFEPAALQGIPAAPPPNIKTRSRQSAGDAPCVLMTHLSVRCHCLTRLNSGATLLTADRPKIEVYLDAVLSVALACVIFLPTDFETLLELDGESAKKWKFLRAAPLSVWEWPSRSELTVR